MDETDALHLAGRLLDLLDAILVVRSDPAPPDAVAAERAALDEELKRLRPRLGMITTAAELTRGYAALVTSLQDLPATWPAVLAALAQVRSGDSIEDQGHSG